jgi:hypothetical protein
MLPERPNADALMTAPTLNVPNEKLRRLKMVAQARGTSVDRLFDEMSTVLLAEADAETRFRLRAERVAGREERGLELLRKAAGTRAER